MYRVTCKQCGASGIAEDGNRLQQAVGCSCCTQRHDHDAASNACPGVAAFRQAHDQALQDGHPDPVTHGKTQQHPGADCAHPFGGTACNVITDLGDDCPGGHCFPGVDGCTCCRPLSVDFLGVVGLGPTAEQIGGAR